MRRGFTLVELMVAAAIGVLIIGVALSFVFASARLHRKQFELGQLRRTSSMVVDRLADELRQAGLGVPRGQRLSGGNEAFPPRLYAGTATSISFLGDLPRPDSSFDGRSGLASDQTVGLPANTVALINAFNGDCDLDFGIDPHCASSERSRVFPTNAANDCTSAGTEVTCPWALGKYRANEFVIVADGDGNWDERRVDPTLFAVNALRGGLLLTAALPASVVASSSKGFLSTPDRTTWSWAGGFVRRNQCWDTVGAWAGLPAFGACGDGTGTENLLRGDAASSLTFSYFDSGGTALAVPLSAADVRRVARVDIALHVERQTSEELHSHDALTTVTFRQ